MRKLGFVGLVAGVAALPLAALQAADSGPQVRRWGNVPSAHIKPPVHRPGWGGHKPSMPKPHWGGHRPGKPGGWHGGGGHRWGYKWKGRWHGGYRAPGGWGGYVIAYPGYQLPSYWQSPSYYLPYQTYGLPAPRHGYTWSRYYDDAVMVDAHGRVVDTRRGVDWDRYEGGYYPDEYDYRRDDGAGGAVAGAVVGGIAGSAIAGRGDRLEGALIGGAVGAATGYAIDRSEDRDRDYRGPGADYPPPGYDGPPSGYDGPPPGYDGPPPGAPYPGDYPDDAVTGGTWEGTWTGRYDDGRPYSYSGRFDGTYSEGARYPAPYDNGPPPAEYSPQGYLPPVPGHNPSIIQNGSHVIINGASYPAGGTVVNGYYYPPATTTTVVVNSQPVTTTHYVEEYVSAPKKTWHAKPKKKWRSKTKCVC